MNADDFRGFLVMIIAVLMIVFLIWLIPKGDRSLLDKGDILRLDRHKGWDNAFEVYDIRTWSDHKCTLIIFWDNEQTMGAPIMSNLECEGP